MLPWTLHPTTRPAVRGSAIPTVSRIEWCSILEHRACAGHAASLASRGLLAKLAAKLDHDIRIETEICTKIEWPMHGGLGMATDKDDDRPSEPGSPLLHPAIVATDFANEEQGGPLAVGLGRGQHDFLKVSKLTDMRSRLMRGNYRRLGAE